MKFYPLSNSNISMVFNRPCNVIKLVDQKVIFLQSMTRSICSLIFKDSKISSDTFHVANSNQNEKKNWATLFSLSWTTRKCLSGQPTLQRYMVYCRGHLGSVKINENLQFVFPSKNQAFRRFDKSVRFRGG